MCNIKIWVLNLLIPLVLFALIRFGCGAEVTVHSTIEKQKAHHQNYRRYGHKIHNKKGNYYMKYKKHKNGDKRDVSSIEEDTSFHLSNKMKSHHLYPYYHYHHHHHSHQISKMDEHNPNSKWPHLSRVQYQPPYIKKYNRRNKQLLDLLEGTMPPSTISQQKKSFEKSSELFMNRKREKSKYHRYCNHKNSKWLMEDLFEAQRANPNNPNTDDDQYVNDSESNTTFSSTTLSSFYVVLPPLRTAIKNENRGINLMHQNELPADDLFYDSIFEEKETVVENNIDKIRREKLHPEIDTKIHDKSFMSGNGNSTMNLRDEANITSSRTNKFMYHRVDAPQTVGAGETGRKQRLPFVAITDRRIEISKMRQKDFEHNRFPMP